MSRCNSNVCPDTCELNSPAHCTTLPRGDRRVAIYLDDADRQQGLLLFGQAGETEIPKAQRRAAAPPRAHSATLPERNSAMAQTCATGS